MTWTAFSGGLLFQRRNRKRLIYSSLTVSGKKDTPWNHSNSQFACGPVWAERKRLIPERRGKTKVWFCSPETRQNPETLRFGAFMLLEVVESGSVLGVWEELQPDAGRWWMSAGSKVRGRALRPLTARQSGELLIFGAEEEEIRALWAFSVSAERGDGELTPPPPVCLSVCLLQR